MTVLSIITRAEARRLARDPAYRCEVFGSDDVDAEWLARIAGGYVPCSGPRRHRGCCSDERPELGGRSCVELANAARDQPVDLFAWANRGA